jgi:hypothetical protein
MIEIRGRRRLSFSYRIDDYNYDDDGDDDDECDDGCDDIWN